MKWQAVIELDELKRLANTDVETVQHALAALGARGLVGFDLAESCYFHRELPFDFSRVEKLQPRLQNARKLIAGGKVRLARRSAEQGEAFVAGSGVEHRVRWSGEQAKCTCPWFAKHGAERGPCKHILAIRIILEESDDE